MTTLLKMGCSSLQIRDAIEYPEAGVLSKTLLKDSFYCHAGSCSSFTLGKNKLSVFVNAIRTTSRLEDWQ